MSKEGVWKYNPDGIGYVMERAPAPHTLSERMRVYDAYTRTEAHTIEGWADEVAALEAYCDALESEHKLVLAANEELSPVDKLNQGYERAGLSSALVVNNKYGKHSAFGYMGRE